MSTTVEIGWEGIGELRARIASRGLRARGLLRKAITDTQLDLYNGIIDKLSGGVLKRRTGTLSRSFRPYPIQESKDAITAIVASSNVEYAPIQERGGTIYPRTSQFLTIPLDAMLTERGVARGSARDVISDPSAYGFTGTFFRFGMLFGVTGAGLNADITPLFLLRSSVTIPAHWFVRDTIREVEEAFRTRVEAAMGN